MLDERKVDEGREYVLRYDQGKSLWYAYRLPLAMPPFSDALELEKVELSDVPDCECQSRTASSW